MTGWPDPARVAWAALPAGDREWLRSLAGHAGPGARVALVGGAVRDALLGQAGAGLDLDVVLEGADVEAVARATGLGFTFHPAFQNATVTLPDGRGVDLVRSRRESYPVPGRNPRPAPGTLEDDLRRRDFSLNALALTLTPDGPGALLDVTTGLHDLRARMLRPLHARSLHEDASRLVRAARLAARLDLTATPALLAQVPDALDRAPLTPRLWAELKLLLQESWPGRAARVLGGWGAGALLPGGKLLGALDARREDGVDVPWTAYAAAALSVSPEPDALAARLGLGDRPAALLARARSDAYFPPRSPEITLRSLLRPGAYLPLTGRDVLALGVPPGPRVGEALAWLAGRRGQGQLRSREEERVALERYLAEQAAAE